ncbi:MAG: PilZ domain-containing protein [Candidatus Omnitrophica bacterium]|nr:PilZ domain-containing protein [Candidatus Omnitrophota bacterium]
MWDGVNRRQCPRALYPCLIKVKSSTPPGPPILTHTENISLGGVRVVIPRKIEALAEVELEIDLKDTLPPVLAEGIVRRAEELAGSGSGRPRHYDTGIKFTNLNLEDKRRIEIIVTHILKKRS